MLSHHLQYEIYNKSKVIAKKQMQAAMPVLIFVGDNKYGILKNLKSLIP
jgi:hypothetical protein